MRDIYLTKSSYTSGLQCPLRLWMRWHEPLPHEERIETAAMRTGNRVGQAARRLHPKGVLVDTLKHDHARKATERLIADTSIPAIFEAALDHDGVRVRIDVLERLAEGGWAISEVKASTSVKDEHVTDVAVQAWVAARSGLDLRQNNLVHIDGEYTLTGVGIELRKLLKFEDLTPRIEPLFEVIPDQVREQVALLKRSKRPQIEPSPHCKKPYQCEFWDRCRAKKPDDWIIYLPRLQPNVFASLHETGIERIGDIPEAVQLSALQARVREAHRNGRPVVSDGLKEALAPIEREAWYFDLESVAPALPIWVGTRPYQQIPFQWSLHHRAQDGSLRHREFLADAISDPRRAFAESLLKALDGTTGPIVVYSSHERHVLDDLAQNLPDIAERLTSLRDRLFDLLPVLRTHYYHPDFRGSFSIKAVAPVLASEIDYSKLDGIDQGEAASEAFEHLTRNEVRNGKAKVIRRQLLAYCKLDTLAMVRVHEALMSEQRGPRRSRGGLWHLLGRWFRGHKSP